MIQGVAAGGCATASAGQDRIWRAAWNEPGMGGSRSQCDLERHPADSYSFASFSTKRHGVGIGFLVSYAILALASTGLVFGRIS